MDFSKILFLSALKSFLTWTLILMEVLRFGLGSRDIYTTTHGYFT